MLRFYCRAKKLPDRGDEGESDLEVSEKTQRGARSVRLGHLPKTGPRYTMTLLTFLQDRIRPAAPVFARRPVTKAGAKPSGILEGHCDYSLEGFHQTASEALASVGQETLWISQPFYASRSPVYF